MLKNFLVLVTFFTARFIYAQDVPAIIREEWSKTPVIHQISAGLEKEPAVIILDRRRIEYIDVKEEQLEYRTLHKIVHLNDDRGIEAFNKIYLPVNENKSIVDIRARTILPGGRIIELDQGDIKEIKEEGSIYKIFALEGLVKGCEIEFLYTYNTNVSYFGREVMQGSFNILKSEIEIVSPERLVFETKSFNGLNPSTDTAIQGKKIVRILQENMPGADEEKYAMYTANLKRVEYKLSYNKAKSESERIFTWNALAKRVHEMHAQFSDKEVKKMTHLVNENKWNKLQGEKEKIIAVENYLKKTFATRDDIYSDDAENIEWIFKNKICSHRGMVRLFAAAYTILGVSHEHVLAGSRENFLLDKSFENWINCDNSLIYFPGVQKYIAPTMADTRFPWIDPSWGAATGIFCKPTTIGNFTTAIAYMKQITLEGADESQSNIEAHVSLNPSLDTLLVDAKQIQTGYSSNTYRRIFNYNSEEDQKEIIRSMVKHNLGTEKILASNIENREFESVTENKPFILQAKVQAPGMVERAGNKVLVKFGELLGPQVEMYQEKQRMFPIELPYAHILARKITMEIPAGYRIRNLDDLKISNVYKENNEVTMGFESDIAIEGNKLTVNIVEQYRKTYYPLEQYDPFKKIINAAADFNKIVLVLEKI